MHLQEQDNCNQPGDGLKKQKHPEEQVLSIHTVNYADTIINNACCCKRKISTNEKMRKSKKKKFKELERKLKRIVKQFLPQSTSSVSSTENIPNNAANGANCIESPASSQNHGESHVATEPASYNIEERCSPTPCSDESNTANHKENAAPPRPSIAIRQTQMTICPVCNAEHSKSNIRRHLKLHAGKQNQNRATCVDAREGLFLVSKNDTCGKVHPCHVKFKLSDSNNQSSTLECAEESCKNTVSAASRGNQNFVCLHLKQAINIPRDVVAETMPPLDQVSCNQRMKESLLQLIKKAEEAKANLVVKWGYESDSRHYSVFNGKIHYWSPFGRAIVNVYTDRLVCSCTAKYNCVHKGAVRAVLHQDDSDFPLSGLIPTPATVQPQSLLDWISFLQKSVIPPDTASTPFSETAILKPWAPKEVTCPWCASPLTTVSVGSVPLVDLNFVKNGRYRTLF
jgi:hypothetical protein